MKRYKFTVREHEEFGTLGYAPSWYPDGDPLTGMAVAHDILEHFPNMKGLEAELMASGACLVVRGNTGYFMNGTPIENIASEYGDFWMKRPSVRPCPNHVRNEETRDTAREFVAKVYKTIRESLENSDIYLPEETDLENMRHWAAHGIQKAQKRYKDPYSVMYSLFRGIEKEADRLLKHAEEYQILTVSVDYKHFTFTMSLDYPEEKY